MRLSISHLRAPTPLRRWSSLSTSYARRTLRRRTARPPDRPSGALTTATFAAAVGATAPEGLVIADESNTSGVHLYGALQYAPPHRWMTLTGGAIAWACRSRWVLRWEVHSASSVSNPTAR